MDKIKTGFARKECLVAVMIDFEAAFYKVPVTTITLQCTRLGIKGNTLHFFTNILEKRFTKTINGIESDQRQVNIGTPHGLSSAQPFLT